jgi:hypothetical protein
LPIVSGTKGLLRAAIRTLDVSLDHRPSMSHSWRVGLGLLRHPALAPEILEPVRREFGVAHRVLDVLVAEPSLALFTSVSIRVRQARKRRPRRLRRGQLLRVRKGEGRLPQRIQSESGATVPVTSPKKPTVILCGNKRRSMLILKLFAAAVFPKGPAAVGFLRHPAPTQPQSGISRLM